MVSGQQEWRKALVSLYSSTKVLKEVTTVGPVRPGLFGIYPAPVDRKLGQLHTHSPHGLTVGIPSFTEKAYKRLQMLVGNMVAVMVVMVSNQQVLGMMVLSELVGTHCSIYRSPA